SLGGDNRRGQPGRTRMWPAVGAANLANMRQSHENQHICTHGIPCCQLLSFGWSLPRRFRGRLAPTLRLLRDRRSTRWTPRRWPEDGFHTKTWDRLVHELVTATGAQEQNGAVTYMLKGRYTLSVTEMTDLTSRYFLGVQLNCAQCHNHPFAAWKQSDYWGLASFFTQIQRLKPVIAFTTIEENNIDPRKLPESQ